LSFFGKNKKIHEMEFREKVAAPKRGGQQKREFFFEKRHFSEKQIIKISLQLGLNTYKNKNQGSAAYPFRFHCNITSYAIQYNYFVLVSV
jgi:hypothetical protein